MLRLNLFLRTGATILPYSILIHLPFSSQSDTEYYQHNQSSLRNLSAHPASWKASATCCGLTPTFPINLGSSVLQAAARSTLSKASIRRVSSFLTLRVLLAKRSEGLLSILPMKAPPVGARWSEERWRYTSGMLTLRMWCRWGRMRAGSRRFSMEVTAIALIFLDRGDSTWLYWRLGSPYWGSRPAGSRAKLREGIRGRKGRMVGEARCIDSGWIGCYCGQLAMGRRLRKCKVLAG
jgi:hypothetical protein